LIFNFEDKSVRQGTSIAVAKKPLPISVKKEKKDKSKRNLLKKITIFDSKSIKSLSTRLEQKIIIPKINKCNLLISNFD
tara:strand:- start:408 stop:644 length:237 start_codon:yes stop_codon:yes gene_type:complete